MGYHITEQVQKFLDTVPFGKNPITQYSFVGPAGCGKTELAALIHKRLGLPPESYMRFVCSKDTTIYDLMLERSAKDGNVFDYEQRFLQLMQRPSVIVLDELPLAPADVAAALNSVLDQDRCWTAPDGRVFKRHEKCHIILTSNPASYAGVKKQHGGFVDRFPTLAMDYADDEAKILLESYPSVGEDLAQRLVKFAELVRNAIRSQNISTVVSTRGLLSIGAMVENGAEPISAIRMAVKVEDGEAELVNQLARLALGASVVVDKKTGEKTIDVMAAIKEEKKRMEETIKAVQERADALEKRVNSYTEAFRKAVEASAAAAAKKA